MKKCRVCAVFLVLTVIMMLFSACSQGEDTSEASEVTDEQIVQALKNGGFQDAHIVHHEKGDFLYVDANEETWVVVGSNYVDFAFLESTTDISKLLNAVMPLVDEEFSDHGYEIVQELVNSQYKSADGSINLGYVKYHSYTYRGTLDETNTYIDSIFVIM